MNIVIPKHIYINWHHATYELASYLKQQNAPIKFNVFNIFLGPDAIISLVEEIHQEEIDKIYEQVQGLIEGLESMIKHCETCDDSGYVTLINTDLDIDCPDCLGKSILALEKFRGGAE